MLSKKTIPLFKIPDAKKSFLKPHRILEGAKRARGVGDLLKSMGSKKIRGTAIKNIVYFKK